MLHLKTVLHKCQISLIIILSTLTTVLKAQEPFYLYLESEIWDHQHYTTSIQQIKDQVRLKNYTSANVPQQLIYYKGVGYCSDQNIKKGVNNFDWILSNYNLSPNALELIELQKANCIPGTDHSKFDKLFNQNNNSTAVIFVMEVAQPRIVANTKGGFINWDETQVVQLESDKFMGEEPVTEENLKKWLPTDTVKSAIESNLKKRLPVELLNPNIYQSENFILIDYGKNTKEIVSGRLKDLENSLAFISNHHKLKSPDYKMTVYIVEDIDTFNKLGKNLHGLQLSDHLIGYSVDPDLSIVANTPNFYTGTIKHEMTHLLINNNYKAMAPWLSEGIPSIYEVSVWRSGELKGISNWRGNILREAFQRDLVTSLNDLLGYNWLEFNGHTSDGYDKIKLSINHAVARYFCLYLEEKGKLSDVLQAFANRNPDDFEVSVADNAVQIVELILDDPIDSIERDFRRWFNRF